MSDIDKLKKKLEEEVDDLIDVNEDSDLPVTEKKTRQRKVLK